MELSTLFTLLYTLLVLTLSLAYLVLKHKSNVSKNLPPGKTGLPVLGESITFLTAGQKGHPEKFLHERMTRFSSQVFKTSLFAEQVAVFCGASGNKFLFSNENKLVTAWWPKSADKIFPSSERMSTQDEAKKMRQFLPNFLKPEALQRYIGIMDVIAQRHLALDWENKEEVTVFPLAKMYTFWLACRLFLSMEDPEEVAKYAAPFNDISAGVMSVPIDLPGTQFNRGIKSSAWIRGELGKIIKQRKIDLKEKKASPTQDILSHMLTREIEPGKFMDELDIASNILGLLTGGHDTASGVITFVMKYLAELPEVYQKVYEEQMEIANSKGPGELLNWDDLGKMRYSWNVVCEVMRLDPPVQGAFREAMAEFTFAGFSIPKGWKLYWSVNSTHKNSDYFMEPEKFDPTRFEGNGPTPFSYVPFGGGPRMCPGKEYARLEILVFMHNLVKRFKWEKKIPFEKVIVNPLRVPANGFPIRLHAHKR